MSSIRGDGEAAPEPGAAEAARKRDRFSGIMLVLLLGIAFAIVGVRIFTLASGPLPPRAGSSAPAFSAPQLDGTLHALDQHKGQVVLIDFWATWCPPCVASMPALQRIHADLAGRGFSVIGVNIEPGDETTVRAFVQQHRLSFPIVVDPGEIVRRYGVHSYPTSFLVGKDGVIRAVHRGPANERQLRQAIEALLTEPVAAGGGAT